MLLLNSYTSVVVLTVSYAIPFWYKTIVYGKLLLSPLTVIFASLPPHGISVALIVASKQSGTIICCVIDLASGNVLSLILNT